MNHSFGIYSRHRFGLRFIPFALLAVSALYAGNTTTATFGPPTVTANKCAFSTANVTGSGGGFPGNGNHGLILFGSGTVTGTGNTTPPFNTGCIVLNWLGSGSGQFTTSTLPAAWIFTITTPSNVTLQNWALAFSFGTGGAPFQASDLQAARAALLAKRRKDARNASSPSAAGAVSCVPNPPGFTLCDCTGDSCKGTQVGNTDVVVPSGQTFNNYLVQLIVSAQWNDSSQTQVTVNVPQDSSIHINIPQAPSVPAPSGLVLSILGIGALALARVFVKHWRLA